MYCVEQIAKLSFNQTKMTEGEIILQIRLRRKSLKLSQSTLAERMHISLKAYQNIEQGYTKIDITRLRELADILEIDLHQLLFPNHNLAIISTFNYQKEREDYQKLIQDKEKYIFLLEERLTYYRSVLKEQNCF